MASRDAQNLNERAWPWPPEASAQALARAQAAPTRPDLATILDEAALAIHPLTGLKIVLGVLAAALALIILPRETCALWLAGSVGIEAWSWFATRGRAPDAPVRPRTRLNFALAYAAANLWWLLLAVLFWRAGTPVGHAAGLVLFLALVSIATLLFYNTPVIFMAMGAVPAIGALVVLALGDGHSWLELAPVLAMLGLTMIFGLGRALDTPTAQEQHRRLNASLRDYQLLTETVTEIIARIDMSGVHQYLSPAVYPVLGYRPEELVGGLRRDLIHPDSLASVHAAINRMIADPGRSEIIISRVRHKDGRWVWLETRAKILLEGGVPVGIIDVSHDITERLAAETALREAKAEAEAATRAKAEFLANVSHEIRTPMNGVLGALHLLDREPVSAEGRELLRQAGDCGRMLSQLLNDVLDFSKIEAGQLSLAPEPMDAGEALAAVAALLSGHAREKGIELRCETLGDDLWIAADPVRIRQCMFNLVGNAVKFTAAGHVIARLSVEPSRDGLRRVVLEVEDTGIGIAPAAQAQLFERFRQAESDTARRFGGAGLGLAISQILARMMGGEIEVESVLGEGSTFRMTFEAPATRGSAAAPTEPGVLQGVSVLLVEDNATNRLVARTMLARLGARVAEAEDGFAGLEAARRGAHDLILMDVQMPRMDGVQATRAIRRLSGPVAETPIIGLTANVMVHQQAEYAAAGMNGVVGKPISPAALLAEIARVVAEGDAPESVASLG